MSNGLSASLETLFGKMEGFLTTKTVVSEPINIGDVILVPLVEVSFGVAAGAYDSSGEGKKGEKDTDGGKKTEKDAGGGGLGAKITPSAVIVITGNNAKLINVNSQFGVNKLLEIAPDILSKIPAFFNGKDKDKKDKHETDDKE
jgi:uncharacterized spore protein YtfJ